MKKLYFLKPLANFLAIGLLIMSLSRMILFLIYRDRIDETENFWYIFPIGIRFDLIILCYLSFLPALLICVFPDKLLFKIKKFLHIYFLFFLFIILLMELSTPNFVNQYDTRPNRLFLDYLIYPKEVFGTLMKSYLTSMIISVIILGTGLYFGYKK